MPEKFFEKPPAEREEITLDSIKKTPPLEIETQRYFKTITLYEKAIKDPNDSVRQGAAQSLGALAPVNPQLYHSLYEKAIKDSNLFVRKGAARSLEAFVSVNPQLASSLYEKAIKSHDEFVRQGAAQSLGALAPVNPQLYHSLYEKAIKDSNWSVRQEAAQSLEALAPVNPQLYHSLYEKAIKDPHEYVRHRAAKSLGALAPVNPQLASSLYEKAIKSHDDSIRQGAAQSLGALAPVNPQLYHSLYEKAIKDPDNHVREGAAKSLGALVKTLKIKNRGNEIINQENLKSLTKSFGLSLKKEDREFFRLVVPLFAKEAAPFLESKALPNTLKYQFKIGLLEELSKEELMAHFQRAISDFNSLSKKKTKEAIEERRLILEFFSLMPISEASHYLATQTEKLVLKLGDLKSIEMRTFKALADTNSRQANMILLSILNQEDLAPRRKEYIFRKLIQNKVLEEDLVDFLGKDKKTKETFFKLLKEFQEYFPGTIPNKAIFHLRLKEGLSFAEIKEKKAEFEKEDLPFSEIISKLAKDRNLASIYFALYRSPYRYDNILSFENFFRLLEKAKEIDEDNQRVKTELRSLWQAKGKSFQQVNQFLELIEKGVPASEQVIYGVEELEREKLKEISLETITNLVRNLVNLEPIFALSGRLQGLLRQKEEKLREMQEKIAQAADYLNFTSGAVFQKENLDPLYQRLYLEYEEILKQKGEEKIPTPQELYEEDRGKFIGLLQKKEVFTPELSLNRQKGLEEISEFVLENIVGRLEKHSKREGKISEKFQALIVDLKGEIKTCLENLKVKIKTKPLRLTFKQVPKFDFKDQKHLIEFMRVGDARESCIATNGINSWSISHYLKDFGTIGFLILEQDKAVGHIIAHLGKDNQENPLLLVSGIFCKGNYPTQAVGQRVALYLEDFAQKTGLAEVLLACSPYAEIIPPNYQQTSRIVQRFQGTQGDLYSDFNTSTKYLKPVRCYQKIKRESAKEKE